jgi:hypothetical protein
MTEPKRQLRDTVLSGVKVRRCFIVGQETVLRDYLDIANLEAVQTSATPRAGAQRTTTRDENQALERKVPLASG